MALGPEGDVSTRTYASLDHIDIVAPNLHRRFSGVTATIVALVPLQARSQRIASVGPTLPASVPCVRFRELLTRGWRRPASGASHRIWHARRNDEMIVGLLLAKLLRQPWKLVFTSAAQRRHTAFTRWLIRQMDAVIATSEAAARFLEVPATVIHHGIDIERFQPAADRRQAWKRSGLPGTYGVGVFGRIRAQKGTDLFVEALCTLLPRYPQWTAVITGLCAPEEATFVAGLKQRIAAAQLQERIHFLGVRPTEEMPAWFQRISLYVAPMRWEGFGLTPLEAMASGTAVVATRTGAAPLLVADGETGILIPPDNLPALTAALEALLADPARAEQMGRAGRLKATQQHAITQEIQAIAAVYASVWAQEKP